MRLLELLVESVLVFGAEVWGCGGMLGSVENVQMRAARIKLGMGSLHLLVSLQFEIDLLPLKWEAFRVQVMRMDDNRLGKVVMLEALELENKVRWVKDLQQSLERCGWRGLGVMALNALTAIS